MASAEAGGPGAEKRGGTCAERCGLGFPPLTKYQRRVVRRHCTALALSSGVITLEAFVRDDVYGTVAAVLAGAINVVGVFAGLAPQHAMPFLRLAPWFIALVCASVFGDYVYCAESIDLDHRAHEDLLELVVESDSKKRSLLTLIMLLQLATMVVLFFCARADVKLREHVLEGAVDVESDAGSDDEGLSPRPWVPGAAGDDESRRRVTWADESPRNSSGGRPARLQRSPPTMSQLWLF